MSDSIIRFAADGLLLLILAVSGVAGGLYVVRNRAFLRLAPYAVMAALTSLLVGKIVSMLYQPQAVRPYIEQGVAAGAAYMDNPGFPSDHTLLATVVVLMLYACTPYRKLSIVLGLLVIIMSAARVAALVHTPLDVVGGAVAGCIGAVWYLHMRHTAHAGHAKDLRFRQ